MTPPMDPPSPPGASLPPGGLPPKGAPASVTYPQVIYAAPPPPKRSGWWARLFTGLLGSVLLISILLNIYFIVLVAFAMRGPTEHSYIRGNLSKRIVILPIEGMIGDDTAEFVRDAMQSLRDQPPEAIVLRVDSGGGGVSASDLIWHELGQFRRDHANIPIVASYGGLAASGGYYVSVGTDFIFAEPTTVTGSIGVIAPAFTVDRLLDKIGVTPEVITATPSVKKDVANNILRPWNDEDRQTIRKVLDHACERFIDVVHQGRAKHLTLEEVRAVATGQIFSADEAKDQKLIDEVGYLADAIEKAKALTGMQPGDRPSVTRLQPASGLNLLGALSGPRVPASRSVDPAMVRDWVGELGTPRVEYRVDWSR